MCDRAERQCQLRLQVARAHQPETDSMANRNFPDFEEDKIACFIKTLTEKRIGPTWHVLVGRYVGACAMRPWCEWLCIVRGC